MSADGQAPGTYGGEAALPVAPVRAAAPARPDDRRFWLWVGFAAVLHAALLIGISHKALQRQLGEPGGSPDGISVEIIDEADLMSRSSVPQEQAGGKPVDAGAIAQPAQPQPQQPQEVTPTPPSPPAQDQKSLLSSLDDKAADLFALPDPTPKQSPSASAKSAPRPKMQLDPPERMSMPGGIATAPGRAAAVARPAGVTRSGENDDFGRGVIRALRQTMPSPRGLLGRVTVRLFLNENGNLTDVRIMKSAGNVELDQSVLFATKQTSFPIPPNRSTENDRVFLVTYIYE